MLMFNPPLAGVALLHADAAQGSAVSWRGAGKLSVQAT